MAILDLNALGAVLKQKYSQKKFYEVGYSKNPTWDLIKKRTDFGGENKVVALRYGTVQGTSPVFADAQSTASPSSFARVTITRVRDYVVAYIDGEALSAAKSSDDTLSLASKEIDSAMMRATRNNGISMFRPAGGSIGNATFSGVTATLVTSAGVAMPSLSTNIEKGMSLDISASDGTSGSIKAGGPFVVQSVNRAAGTFTVDHAWSDAGAAANDYLFVKGAFGRRMASIPGWVPTTAPSSGESWFGLDRSVDQRLYGWSISGNGGPIEETLIEVLSVLNREGAETDLIVLNPLDWSNLVKAIGSRMNVPYGVVKGGSNVDVGYQSVKIVGPQGMVDVIADLNIVKGKYAALQLDTWSFESSGPAPRILEEDGISPILRSPNADAYEVRIGWYGNLVCEAPGLNAYGSL